MNYLHTLKKKSILDRILVIVLYCCVLAVTRAFNNCNRFLSPQNFYLVHQILRLEYEINITV